MYNLTIDKRISEALQPLTPEEFSQLDENCLRDGRILDPIKVWGKTKIIVDGHHRYKIAQKHNLQYDTEPMDFDSIEEIISWVHANQLGRRNISGPALSMSRAARAKQMKESQPLKNKEIAAKLGVSDRQLRTDTNVSEAIERLPDDIKDRVKSSSIVASQTDLLKLDSLNETAKAAAIDKLRDDATKGIHEVLPKPRQNLSESDLEKLSENFDPQVCKMVATGQLHVTSGEIARAMQLNPVKRQVLCDLLVADREDAQTISDALKIIKVPAKRDIAADIAKKKTEFTAACERAMRAADDWAALANKSDGEFHQRLVKAIKNMIAQMEKA